MWRSPATPNVVFMPCDATTTSWGHIVKRKFCCSDGTIAGLVVAVSGEACPVRHHNVHPVVVVRHGRAC